MELKTQKLLTNIGLGVWFLLAGVEYAVIIPTAWLYVESLGGNRFFFGMVFSSFSAASLVSGIIFGIWADRIRKTKWLLIFANLWTIAGNVMYSLGVSKYLVLGSRLLCGMGAGVGSAIFAHLTLTTTNEERTRIFSYFIATRMIGTMVGPGFNFVLRLCNFYIGPIKINAFTAPGVFIAALMILLQIYMVFFLYDLPYIDDQSDNKDPSTAETNKRKEEMQNSTVVSAHDLSSVSVTADLAVSQGSNIPSLPHENTTHVSQLDESSEKSRNSVTSANNQRSHESYHTCHSNTMHSTTVESSEFYKTASLGHIPDGTTEGHINGFPPQPNGIVKNDEGQSSLPEVEDGTTVSAHNGDALEKAPVQEEQGTQTSDNPSFFTLLSDVIREETVVLLALMFCSIFNQVTVETIVTPITEAVFRWGERENSIFYICAAAEMVACYLSIGYISKKFQDRTIIMGGLIMSCLSLAWLVVFLTNTYKPSILPQFIVGAGLQLLSFAPIMIAATSLFSKVTDKRIQGLAHGIRRAVGAIASIMGPLWGGATVHMLNVLLGVMIAMLAIVMILVLLSFRRLKDPQQEKPEEVPSLTLNSEADEETPLLKDAHPSHNVNDH